MSCRGRGRGAVCQETLRSLEGKKLAVFADHLKFDETKQARGHYLFWELNWFELGHQRKCVTKVWKAGLPGGLPPPRPPGLPGGAPPPQTPRTRRLRRQWVGPEMGGGGLRPPPPRFGDPHWRRRHRVRGVWGGRSPPRKAGGSGGREPLRKASHPNFCYARQLVARHYWRFLT